MQPPASPEQVRLTDLVRRRRQLVDAAAQEKQREPIHGQPFVTGSVERHLAFLATEIAPALTGVAPMNRDSGTLRGQAHIAGGRMSARCCPYMATIVAIRCNPAIRPFYKRLREQDKPPKVAIVAAMRKLITVANSMLTYDRP